MKGHTRTQKSLMVSKHQGLYINLQYGCEQIFSFFTYFVLLFGNFVTSKHETILFPFLYYCWLVNTENTSSTLTHTQFHAHPHILNLLTSINWNTLTTSLSFFSSKVFHVLQMYIKAKFADFFYLKSMLILFLWYLEMDREKNVSKMPCTDIYMYTGGLFSKTLTHVFSIHRQYHTVDMLFQPLCLSVNKRIILLLYILD